MQIFAFWVINFEPIEVQNDRLNLSFVKETHAIGKKMAGNGRKTAVYHSLSFLNSLYDEHPKSIHKWFQENVKQTKVKIIGN